MSDETYFYLTNRIWDIERPTDEIEKPLHSEKLLVFFAISATKIYGPKLPGNAQSLVLA